jgi:aspartate kinase
MKVAKFGGSSLANADQIRRVIEIIKSDPEIRCVVVSAPGKRHPEDTKVTDLLYALARCSVVNARHPWAVPIISRYQEIIDDLGLQINFEQCFEETLKNVKNGRPDEKDFIVSNGEYWMSLILSQALGYRHIDSRFFVRFDKNGALDLAETQRLAKDVVGLEKISTIEGTVVPGFYGLTHDGYYKTFVRGGSDITGAIVASCVNASIYENWTDVSGVFVADPRIIENPRPINKMTYRELRELAYMGANVFNDEAIFPVRSAGIPINVRNTNRPQDHGTMIVAEIEGKDPFAGSVVGIAGRKGFSVIKIEKTLMNNEVGFLLHVCRIMAKHGINIEHIPGGIDTLSVIVDSSEFQPISHLIVEELQESCNPDKISVEENMAMVCLVGPDVAKNPTITARLFKAICVYGITVKMINHGASEISIIVGVDEKDYEQTIRAIYNEFTS